MLLSVGYFVGYVYGCCVLKQALFFLTLRGLPWGFFWGGARKSRVYFHLTTYKDFESRKEIILSTINYVIGHSQK